MDEETIKKTAKSSSGVTDRVRATPLPLKKENLQKRCANQELAGKILLPHLAPHYLKGKKVPGYDKKSFDTRPKEERVAIAVKGGLARRGKGGKHYTLCSNCELRLTCPRAYEEFTIALNAGKPCSEHRSRCVYEMEGRRSKKMVIYKDNRAFVGNDPRDLLAKMQTIFAKLEAVVYEDPDNYNKLVNLMYIMINLYKLKFPKETVSLNLHSNVGGTPVLDIKSMMSQMRKNVVDAEYDHTDQTETTQHTQTDTDTDRDVI